MSRELVAHNRPVFDRLHPKIYGAAVGLIAWFALMAWVLFDRSGYVSLALTFVTVLFVVAVRAARGRCRWSGRNIRCRMSGIAQPTTFHDWRAGDFEVWGAKLHGTDAAIDVLLPLMAVSFGLTAIGIVFVIVRAFVNLTTCDQRFVTCSGPPLASEMRAPPRPLIMPSSRSRSFSKLVMIAPSSERPRGSLMRMGSTKRPLTRIS